MRNKRSCIIVRHVAGGPAIKACLMDTGEYRSRREASTALETVSAAIRSWLLAWTEAMPMGVEAQLRIPGAISITISWRQYQDRFPPWLCLKLRTSRDVSRRLHRARAEAYKNWAAQYPEAAAKLKRSSEKVGNQQVVEGTATDAAGTPAP